MKDVLLLDLTIVFTEEFSGSAKASNFIPYIPNLGIYALPVFGKFKFYPSINMGRSVVVFKNLSLLLLSKSSLSEFPIDSDERGVQIHQENGTSTGRGCYIVKE